MHAPRIIVVASLLLLVSTTSADHHSTLTGNWIVDLRPVPNAEPYFKAMEIGEIDGNAFSGTFYGTPFTDGVLNADWGSIHFAFTTEDGRTSYHHSGELKGDKIVGRTHAPGRRMLSIWSAEKSPD